MEGNLFHSLIPFAFSYTISRTERMGMGKQPIFVLTIEKYPDIEFYTRYSRTSLEKFEIPRDSIIALRCTIPKNV